MCIKPESMVCVLRNLTLRGLVADPSLVVLMALLQLIVLPSDVPPPLTASSHPSHSQIQNRSHRVAQMYEW